MPQLSSGGGDDQGANDEMISFKDEGEQDEKIQENAFTERDLADLKSSLVNESETSSNATVRRLQSLMLCAACEVERGLGMKLFALVQSHSQVTNLCLMLLWTLRRSDEVSKTNIEVIKRNTGSTSTAVRTRQ